MSERKACETADDLSWNRVSGTRGESELVACSRKWDCMHLEGLPRARETGV